MDSQNRRLQSGVTRGPAFQVEIDGQPVTAFPGETLATVLLAAGLRTFRRTPLTHEPRGLYCGMGVCFDCLVTVNGRPNVRACLTPAQPGDQVQRQF
jgi:aerobic-type carbon monoxide dehydrogenase small subunit (CoxS/CutS family)